MSFKSVNDIDWSDPVAANRQLRQQLKMLEAQEQGGHGEALLHANRLGNAWLFLQQGRF